MVSIIGCRTGVAPRVDRVSFDVEQPAPGGLPPLRRGAHADPGAGLCLMEYVSLHAGSGFSDRPRCTHPALAALARRVNDEVSDRARPGLAHLAPALRGTNTSCPAAEQAVVIACARTALGLAPDDRALGRILILATAEHLRLTAARRPGARCRHRRGPLRGVVARTRRRHAAYRAEIAVHDALNRLVRAVPAPADRDAVLVGLLVDVVAAHRRACSDLETVEIALPGVPVPAAGG